MREACFRMRLMKPVLKGSGRLLRLFKKKIIPLLGLTLLSFYGLSCGTPKLDVETEEGRAAIIDLVNALLTEGKCADAIRLIDPLYSSQYTNNTVRLLRSSAYACYAGVDYLSLLSQLVSGTTASGEFWTILAKLFNKTDTAGLEAAWTASDTLLSVLDPNRLIASSNQLNSTTVNPGSIDPQDRTTDGNHYLTFTSMAVIGRTENRNGKPDSSYHKTVNLPWTTAATVTSEGCAYASAVVSMLDGIRASVSVTSGSIKTTLQKISTTFETAVGLACEAGCRGTVGSGCAFAAGSCTGVNGFCPTALRNRSSCSTTNPTTNVSNCAAQGIVTMINIDPVLKWPN